MAILALVLQVALLVGWYTCPFLDGLPWFVILTPLIWVGGVGVVAFLGVVLTLLRT